jgi:hypothetical protein
VGTYDVNIFVPSLWIMPVLHAMLAILLWYKSIWDFVAFYSQKSIEKRLTKNIDHVRKIFAKNTPDE